MRFSVIILRPFFFFLVEEVGVTYSFENLTNLIVISDNTTG